jgi:hypothetical protein
MNVEEWWGRTFEQRGTIKADNMPAVTPDVLRKLSTPDLCELIRSEGNNSVRGLLSQIELRRRENWTGRAAFVVSLLALLVAALHR